MRLNAPAQAPAPLLAPALAPAINDLSSELGNCTAGCHGAIAMPMLQVAVDATHAVDATNRR